MVEARVSISIISLSPTYIKDPIGKSKTFFLIRTVLMII